MIYQKVTQDLLNMYFNFFSFSRIQLERAVMLLDLEAKDMNQTLYALVEELNHAGLLEDELKGEVLRILLYKYVIQCHEILKM